jgi:4-hydroxy-3-polyprenylbenzoate decarboxylase
LLSLLFLNDTILKSLKEFINELDKSGDLIRIKEFVSTELEITEVADRMMKDEKGGKAILFENTGTQFPLLINHYGSDSRTLKALCLKSFLEPSERIDRLMSKAMGANKGLMSGLSLLPELKAAAKWMPSKRKGKGSCQEVIMEDPDLNKLPILKCWPHDGGKFITLPMVISEDPETRIRNIGMYRMQVFDSKSTGMHWHLHKGGAVHFEKYKKLGKKMPITVVLGGEPALTYTATAPMPENIDEFILAGFLTNKKIKLVKSLTNDIYIPENADIVIEGYVDPNEDFKTEGPFGDHTGFYSLADQYPVFHVTAITHRKEAVYPATIVGVPPMEDFYLGKATEKIFLKPIQIAIAPEVIDMRLPSYGVAHNLVLIKAKTSYRGQSLKIMNALLGAGQMMFSKVIVRFNENVDIEDDEQVIEAILNNVDPQNDIFISKGPSDVLDHSSYEYTYGGKLLIDAGNVPETKQEKSYLNYDDVLFNHNGLYVVKSDFNTDFETVAHEILKDSKAVKLLVIVDSIVEITDPYLLAWLTLNNIDPSEDYLIVEDTIVLDASVKSLTKDSFKRDWPNVCINSQEAINKADKIYDSIPELKEFAKNSPSFKVSSLFKGDSAVFGEIE